MILSSDNQEAYFEQKTIHSTLSWSFINHDKQRVIFGAWDTEREKERAVILREEWAYNHRNKKQPGYTQAIEHIRYILEGYELFTFNMIHAPNPDNPDIAVIKDFERHLNHSLVCRFFPESFS